VLRRVEQDPGLVAGDRGGIPLGATLALDEGEIEADRRRDGGLAVAPRDVDHRLAKASGRGAPLD
jgi:hypothetical protein